MKFCLHPLYSALKNGETCEIFFPRERIFFRKKESDEGNFDQNLAFSSHYLFWLGLVGFVSLGVFRLGLGQAENWNLVC